TEYHLTYTPIDCRFTNQHLFFSLLPPPFHNPPHIPNVWLPTNKTQLQNDIVSIVLTFPPIYFDALIFLFCITIGQLAADQHHRQREHLAFLVLKAKRLQQSICLFLSHSLTALQSFYRRM